MFFLLVAVVLIFLFWPKQAAQRPAVAPMELAPPVVIAPPKPDAVSALQRVKSELVRRGAYGDEQKNAISILTVALVSGDVE